MIGGRVLDTSALADYASGRAYVQSVVGAAQRTGSVVLAIPATVLMEARGNATDVSRKVLTDLLTYPPVVVIELTTTTAMRAGDLLARAQTPPSASAMSAAHVAFTARVRSWPVVTSEPERLLALDAALEIERMP